MADPRSVMQEFRFLEQKRQAGPLTADEAARHAELRDLVGFEQPLPARGGFDVTAAAAQLRESLLPAGLRARPADAPPPPPPPAMVAAPAAVTPAAPAAEPAPMAADLLFDPASLGQEVRPQAWNPEAPGYDPDAPYDEAAWIAAGYDPSVTYDWSAADAAIAAAPEAEAPAEITPLEFGEYDAPGRPVSLVAPVEEPAPPPAPAPDGGAWFDDSGPAPAAPPLPAPTFGDYDAPAAPAPASWLPDGAFEAGFELASDGSFGEATAPPLLAPWTAVEESAAQERWESVPALDLSTPFQPTPIPADRHVEPVPQALDEPPGHFLPEDALEPIVETLAEAPPGPGVPPALETLPAEPGWPPSPDALAEPATGGPGPDAEPVSLDDLETSVEIDVPPEISAAYDLPQPTSPRLDFDSPELLPPGEPGAPDPDPDPDDIIDAVDPVEPEAELEPVPLPAGPGTVVAGEHRVVVHTLDGEVLRGTLTDSDLEAPELELDTGGPGLTTQVISAGVKAIFFMLAPGEPPPTPGGKRVRVAFRDGRQVAGFSPDYQEGGVGFFMIPADTRTNTGRIWVYHSAVKQVSVS
jgi:hypothetical protein